MAEERTYTIAEVAKLLSVSRSTVWRWVRSGRLRAYRIGPRTIRIRGQDLDELVMPSITEARPDSASEKPDDRRDRALAALFPVTEETVRRRREAIEGARKLQEEILAAHGGKPLSPSWPIIRRSRAERSRRI